MGSSFSSRREPLVQHAGDMTGSTDGGLHQLSMTSRKSPQIPNKKTVKLCSRCKKINLKDFFDHETTSMTPQPQHMLYLGKLEKKTTCALCQFFYSMRRRQNKPHEEEEVYTLRSSLVGSQYALSAAYSASHYAPSRVLDVAPGKLEVPDYDPFFCYVSEEDRIPSDVYWIIPQSSTAASFFSHEKPSLSALPFSPTFINYPLLRAWCEHCDLHHSTCASATKHRSDKQGVGPAIRCIDCHTREIVEIATSDRFFALSYVWGKQPAPLSGVRQLPKVIPRVIEDAMIVVANLGERYLWVDQYCIDQDDVHDKHAQIGNMAAIYEGAYATIVAFSATDSASGLPGVRTLARTPCPSVAHPKLPLSALQPSPISSAQLVNSSVWMTRGWTYQEAILSRRLLIFTDYQVEFICSNAVWHECTLPGTGVGSLRTQRDTNVYRSLNFLEDVTPMERPAGKTPVRVLARCIEEYSARHLTYESDVLNAITGFFSRISTLTYLGIPVLDQHDLAAGPSRALLVEKARWQFLTCLVWYPALRGRTPLRRRYAFPSWSWLGWEGQIAIPGLRNYIKLQCREPEAHANVWITNQVTQTEGETLVPLAHLLEEPRSGKEPTSILPHLNNYLWVEGLVIKMAFTIHHNHKGEGIFTVKSCHPPMRLQPYGNLGEFRNCSPDRPTQGTVHQRIMTEQWDCLLLVVAEREISYPGGHFLILDQVQQDEDMEAEECYNVVGTAEVHLWDDIGYRQSFIVDPWDDPSLRRRIKLC